jgi:hypothetical protein
MVTHILFVTGFGILTSILLAWSFKNLPQEKWQVLAVIPYKKTPQGGWLGFNITYYGFFSGLSYMIAIALFIILMSSTGIPLEASLLAIILMLGCCIPASKILARLIEKKKYTFSVGAAAFTGILLLPIIAIVVNRISTQFNRSSDLMILLLAATSIAYLFGEGIGRLACISFGCCYGKELSKSHVVVQKIFKKFFFIFYGKTKKIAYASGLEGVPVIPIQAITSMLYTLTGLITTLLFLETHFKEAFMIASSVSLAWRVYSETLRADYRGGGKISVYQTMSLAGIIYSLVLIFIISESKRLSVDITVGLQALWSPQIILLLEVIGLGTFLYTGKSMVTESHLSIYTKRDNI